MYRPETPGISMNISSAKTLINKAKSFRFDTFNEVIPEDLRFARVFVDSENVIVAVSHDPKVKIRWACNNPQDTIDEIRKLPEAIAHSLHMEFVPERFVPAFESMGFDIACEYLDFWLDPLLNIPASEYRSDLLFRDATISEYSDVRAITRECSTCSRGFTVEDEESLRTWQQNRESRVTVATNSNAIVGYCLTAIYGRQSDKGPVVWIRELATRPCFHRNGYASALLNYVLKWGIRNGATRSFLACDVENTPAISLYRKFGFRENPGRGQINMVRLPS
jgi:ribosomal protein S18 acetylase RimI-like enzyme